MTGRRCEPQREREEWMTLEQAAAMTGYSRDGFR